jgi:Flp pilus assembly protein TadD
MKKVFTAALVAMMVLSLSACAGTKNNKVRTKCPACGYEFEAPVE